MEETTSLLSPMTMRSPLTDASNRINNCLTPITEQGGSGDGHYHLTSPDQMSIVNSPLSPKDNVDRLCISPVPDSRAGSKRNSAVSAGSIASGKGKRKTHVGPWQLGKTLGSGATGRVRLAKHAMTGQTAAIKIVSKKSAAITQSDSIAAMDRNAGNFIGTGTRQMPSGIEREVVIMKLIEHPNVISLYDVWENRGELYLVLEYVEGGELFDYVLNHGPLPEEEAVRLFRQIIAGLGYCHRFNICHRDLKPENILLDAEFNVKLADFGMAALQPAGHWLNTSCGSPHYAAPEIIYGRKYRGDKADIWSCGIILYALLTGFLPFDGGDLHSTLQLVRKADYYIPPNLSDNAADLIRRILQKKPEDRITMENIWRHPLLKMYEKFHQVRSKHYLGPAPPLSVQDCGVPVTSRQDIDIDLLRNLQTLWHDVKPEQLVERLLNPEPTHERMFYNALVKFRNEQLENYQGEPLGYSASDYHHISRAQDRVSKHARNRSQGGSRRRSHLPAVKETGKRKAQPREPKSSATVENYDPFRCPVSPLSEKEPQPTRVAIYRNDYEGNRQQLRLEIPQSSNPFLDDDPDAVDCSQSPPFAVVGGKKQKVDSVKSFQSKASHSGSRRALNTTSTPRSVSYKRNVCFRHTKNCSRGSMSAKTKKRTEKIADTGRQPSEGSLQSIFDDPFSDTQSSLSLPAQPKVVRGAGITIKKCCQPKKVRNSDIIWKDEARKVSHELSQICEEAFNGSSLSTGRTESTCIGSETPPTSVSIASPEVSSNEIDSSAFKKHSQPQTPQGSPQPSYPGMELAETRRKLIEHSSQDGSGELPAYLVTIIGHLDRLIEQDKARQCLSLAQTEELRSSMHDLFSKMPNEPGPLPIISEELNLSPEKPSSSNPEATTEPTNSISSTEGRPCGITRTGKRSIRMVPRSSFQSIDDATQLAIRKTRNEPTGSGLKPGTEDGKVPSNGAPHDHRHSYTDRADEMGPSGRNGARTPDHKKWSWFRRSQAPEEIEEKAHQEVKPIHPSSATVIVHELDEAANASKLEQEAQEVRRKKSTDGHKGGFFRKLMRRKINQNIPDTGIEPSPAMNDTLPQDDHGFETDKMNKTRLHRPRFEGKSQNWFARVFQFKPATKVVALNTSKVKGRRDVHKILRDWKQYGLEDVRLDKASKVLYGRVGEVNFLRLKPVEFSAEFYTFIEDGRQANLSLVRFKQERGAASSFNKVVDTLYIVMKQKGLLVENPVRAKKMTQILDAFPS